MCRLRANMILAAMAAWASIAAHTTSAQISPVNSLPDAAKPAELGSLKICLRLEDHSPFTGAAQVRAFPEQGYELLGGWDRPKGEVAFYAVPAGTYLVDVSAPGFSNLRVNTDLQAGRQRTLLVVLKPGSGTAEIAPTTDGAPKTEELKAEAPRLPPDTTTAEPTLLGVSADAPQPVVAMPRNAKESRREWKEEEVPVDRSVACPTNAVLRSAGERVKEFVGSMEKFTATELVEHYPVTKTGERKSPETRRFAYVVIVSKDGNGTFGLQEYRDGQTDARQFPANLATMGLPAVVLVFHPEYQLDFEFACEGLVHEEEHQYWLMRFAQREERAVRIESYVVNGSAFPIYLQGRAWIDAGRGQVVRLESDLEHNIPQIELWQQHQIINYEGVKFASTGQEVWLPHAAEVYVERHGKRFYRRHAFQDFRLFNVDTSQEVKAPKGGSFSFTNVSDSDMTGELTVLPVTGVKGGPITLRFEVPAHRTVIKAVGIGKDVNLPVAEVGSAKFVHTGTSGAVKVDVDLAKETTLDVIPESAQIANP